MHVNTFMFILLVRAISRSRVTEEWTGQQQLPSSYGVPDSEDSYLNSCLMYTSPSPRD